MLKSKLFILSFLLFSALIYAQDIKPRVAVFPLDGGGDYQLEIVSDRITSTAELVLKMLVKYEVSESPAKIPQSISEYCSTNNIDSVITGKSFFSDDGETINVSMSVYNREEGRITLETKEQAESVFDVFDAAETAVYDLLEGFSGEHIAFGSIAFKNTGVEGDYSVLVDSNEYQHVDGKLDKVLNGDRHIKVFQKRMLGPYIIAEGNINITEGNESIFDISIPGFLAEEAEIIGKREKVIDKYWEKRTKAEKVEKAFNELESALAVSEYSRTADDKKNEILLKRKEWDSQKLFLAKGDGEREVLVGLRARALVYSQLNDTFDFNKATYETGGSTENLYNEDLQFCEFPVIPQPGIFAMYQLSDKYYLQPELHIVKTANPENIGEIGVDNTTFSLWTMDMPILLNRKLSKNFFLFGGPVFQYYLSDDAEEKLGAAVTNVEVNSKFGFALLGGAGYKIKLKKNYIIFDLRYQLGMTNFLMIDGIDPGDIYDFRYNMYTFSFAYAYNFGGDGLNSRKK